MCHRIKKMVSIFIDIVGYQNITDSNNKVTKFYSKEGN